MFWIQPATTTTSSSSSPSVDNDKNNESCFTSASNTNHYNHQGGITTASSSATTNDYNDNQPRLFTLYTYSGTFSWNLRQPDMLCPTLWTIGAHADELNHRW
jgi:hypothetical protein